VRIQTCDARGKLRRQPRRQMLLAHGLKLRALRTDQHLRDGGLQFARAAAEFGDRAVHLQIFARCASSQ
jgi:hypothetical protein